MQKQSRSWNNNNNNNIDSNYNNCSNNNNNSKYISKSRSPKNKISKKLKEILCERIPDTLYKNKTFKQFM